MKDEHEHDEATEREAKLKEQRISRLKDKNDALIKEHVWVIDAATQMDHFEVQHRLTTDRAMMREEWARAIEEHARAKSNRARAIEDRIRVLEVRANTTKNRTVQVVEEYKDSDAFKIDTAVAIVGAYNLWFDDWKKKIVNAFPSLDLH